MMMKRCLLAALFLSRCASLQRDAGVADVQREVAARTGQNVEVRSSTVTTDDERVRSMLAAPLDAEKAVAVALINNARVQFALADIGVARGDLLEASTIRNPVFGGEIRFPGSPSKPYELSITQSLIDLIQLPRRRAAGRAAFDAAAFRAASEVLSLASEVRTDFYELLAATQHVTMNRTATEAARSAAELARRQHEAGNTTDLDFENQQANYEQAKLALARSEEAALLGREVLIRAMGLRDASIEWSVADVFPALPPQEVAPTDIQDLLAARRLDIAAARRDVEAFRQLLPGSRVSGVGDIDAGLHREHETAGETTTGPAVEIPIPIFNGGAASRARTEAQLRRAEERLASLTAEAGSQARAALQSVSAARSRVDYYRDVVLPRRQRIVALTQLEHNAMLVGVFQLLQAKQNELDARREYIDAQRDYWAARNNLERSLSGTDMDDRNTFRSATTPWQDKTAARGGH